MCHLVTDDASIVPVTSLPLGLIPTAAGNFVILLDSYDLQSVTQLLRLYYTVMFIYELRPQLTVKDSYCLLSRCTQCNKSYFQ